MNLTIAICGHPGAGKTTYGTALAKELSATVMHTDFLSEDLPWSKQSDEVTLWFDRKGALGPLEAKTLIIEGMTVVRALRKWLQENPEGRPCDVLFWLATKDPSPMGKQADTILKEILPDLITRGVAVGRREAKP